MSSLSLNKLKKRTPPENGGKPKKKADRFDGLSEEEVQKYTLPDYLRTDLDVVVVGINPSLMAAHRGRYYAGPGNHFYKLLYESGLTPRFVSFDEDYKLLEYGIGLTNIVERPTRSSAELKRTEMKEGSLVVEEKLLFYKPKIAIFNGKCIYEIFANKTSKSSFHFGLQPETVGETMVWVVPSSSARCANFPRMSDKLHFYLALKKHLLYLKGEITDVDPKEFCFEGKCRQFIPRTSKMWRRKNVSAFLHGGRVANKDTVCLDTSEENIATVRSTEFIVRLIKDEENDNESGKTIEDKGNIQSSIPQVLSVTRNNNKCKENENINRETKGNGEHGETVVDNGNTLLSVSDVLPLVREQEKYKKDETVKKELQNETINNSPIKASITEPKIKSNNDMHCAKNSRKDDAILTKRIVPKIKSTQKKVKRPSLKRNLIQQSNKCEVIPNFVNLIKQRLSEKASMDETINSKKHTVKQSQCSDDESESSVQFNVPKNVKENFFLHGSC